ncbi:glycosyltransferase family 4 protein [Microbulbifer sp. SSSA008]|uniref:glycosyltransferase family 4 protein n=1 Tax=Microbulbifer sp. SSSA008 TaxID=3243380 RepID=UPI004039A871
MFDASGLKKSIKGFFGGYEDKSSSVTPESNRPVVESSVSIPGYLYDADFYSREKAQSGVSPEDLYDLWVQEDINNNISASKLFDITFYQSDNPDLEGSFIWHYINHGRFEGRSPNVLFESDYVRGNAELNCEAGDMDLFGYWFKQLLSKRVSSGIVWDFYLSHYVSSSESENLENNFVRLASCLQDLGITNKEEALIFVAIFSRYTEGSVNNEWLSSLEEWMEAGCPADFSILFDVAFYSERAGVKFNSGIDAFRHWFRERRSLIPNSIFCKEFYLDKYEDLVAHPDPFLHFILHGRYEGRSPNPLLNEHFLYIERSKSPSCVLNSWIHQGLPTSGLFPGFDVLLSNKLYLNDFSFSERLDLCLSLLETFTSSFSDFESFEIFIHSLSQCKLLKVWELGEQVIFLKDPLSLSYLYNQEFVKQEGVADGEIFNRWYNQHKSIDASTASFFDAAYYRSRYLDLANYEGNIFIHFLKHGQYENRSPGPLLDTQWIAYTYDLGGSTALEFYFSSEASGEAVKPSAGMSPLRVTCKENVESKGLSDIALECLDEGIFNLSDSSKLQQMIVKAAEIEPLIKRSDNSRAYSLMPYNSDPFAYMKGLSDVVGKSDILIFRDSINFGGADVILGLVYESFKIIYPGKGIKVISMGPVDEKVLAPRKIDSDAVVNLSEISRKCHPDVLEHIVYDIIVGSGAKQVLNLNCGILWKTIENYGRILTRFANLQGYFFCDDRDSFGNVAGYPAEYFLTCSQYLDAIFFDSHFLLKEIKRRGMVVGSVTDKISVLKTPFQQVSIENSTSPRKKYGNRIAWAGRFDEQKRPDLLVKIAQAMPDVEFYVWGKAVLGVKDYGLESVNNIHLMGLYTTEQEMLDSGCHAFLYTSEWDGVPTILLRILELNLPIVASNVGGVGELLPKDFLVDDIEDITSYVNKLKSILMDLNPAKETFRSHFMNDRAARNFESYVEALREAV